MEKINESVDRKMDALYSLQYKDYNFNSVVLLPIEEEIEKYWDTPVTERKGYNVDIKTETVMIPHFLLKINGRYKNNKDYVTFVKKLIDVKNVVTYNKNVTRNKFTNVKVVENEDFRVHATLLSDYFKKSRVPLTKEEIRKYLDFIISINGMSNSYFHDLTKSKQKRILDIVTDIIYDNKDTYKLSDIENIMSAMYSIPEKIIILVNNFDYYTDVPKIVFENCDFSSYHDYIMVDILGRIGLDIIILEVSGKATIEKKIDINTISLGYFFDNYDFSKNMASTKTKLKEWYNSLDFDEVWKYIYVIFGVISLIGAITTTFTIGGVPATIFQIIVGVIFTIILLYAYNCRSYNCGEEEFFLVSAVIYYVILAIILIARGICALPETTDYSQSTAIYSGCLDVSDYSLETKEGYTIKSKKDAVMATSETEMYLYIENNECNDEDVYFTIYDGEKKLFYSETMSPYEYVKKISSNRYYTSESDIPLTVKYYSSEDNSLLGSQEIILHIVKDLDKALEDYKLK